MDVNDVTPLGRPLLQAAHHAVTRVRLLVPEDASSFEVVSVRAFEFDA
jgi:hypothetical protein